MSSEETHLNLWNKIDPRIKIIWAVIFSFYIAAQKDIFTLCLSLFFALISIGLAGLSIKDTLKKLKPVNAFVLFFWLILPFTIYGPTFIQIGWFKISKPAFSLCLMLSIKANTLMLLFFSFILSLSVSTLGYALQELKVSGKLVYLFLFAYRYLFLLKEEKDKLFRSLKVKGFKPKTNLFTYKTYAYLVGLIILRAYDKGDRVHKALVLRGFKGKFYSLYPYKLGLKDIYFSFINLVIFTLLLWQGRYL
ncbi:energy-coupling factor transporter transmembrane component T family protein [Desulfonauticus submarinus]